MAHFWFAFDVGAYEDSTAHLTMLQDGAYNRLLRHYYKTAKPIPEESAQIIRISGAHSVEEIEAVTYILKEFFRLKSDGYHNIRADKELLKSKQVIKLRKELGRKGGAATARAKAIAKATAKEAAKTQTVTVTVTDTNIKTKSSSTAEIGIDAATQKVFIELLLAGNEARMLCHDAVNAYVHGNKCTFEVAADSLISLWQEYDSTVKEFKRGVFKFFKEGLWRSPESWRVNGEGRRNTQARKDLTTEADPDCEKCCGSGYDARDRKVCRCTERALAKGAN